MKYIRIQYKNNTDFITISEYIEQKQPSVLLILLKLAKPRRCKKDVTAIITAVADISGRDKQYASVMTERPKSGRGGLLPGEKEEDL